MGWEIDEQALSVGCCLLLRERGMQRKVVVSGQGALHVMGCRDFVTMMKPPFPGLALSFGRHVDSSSSSSIVISVVAISVFVFVSEGWIPYLPDIIQYLFESLLSAGTRSSGRRKLPFLLVSDQSSERNPVLAMFYDLFFSRELRHRGI